MTVIPPPPNDDDTSSHYSTIQDYIIYNLVFQAERAWAQACSAQQQQTQQQYGQRTKTKPSQHHKIAQRRFNKAVKWAQHLVDLVGGRGQPSSSSSTPTSTAATSRLQQECVAYLSWMKGNKALESKDYVTAFRQYATCQRTLVQLVTTTTGTTATTTATTTSTTTTTNDDLEIMTWKDVWSTRAETVLKPLIRFCQYEAKDLLDNQELTLLDSTTTTGTDSSNKKNTTSTTSTGIQMALEFRNKVVDLEAYPSQLAVLFLKMEETLQDTQKQKEEKVFLQLLADLDDALNMVSSETARYASLPAGPTVSAKRSELATLKCYFTYHKLQLQRQHQEDTLLTDTTSTTTTTDRKETAEDLFHFYDALLHNAQAVADLAVDYEGNTTTNTNNNNDVEDEDYNLEDDPYWLEAQAHVVRIRAFRCYYLACVYDTVLGHQGSSSSSTTTTQKVWALLQQARILQRRAAEEVAACDLDDTYLVGLQDLQTKISVMQCRIEATRYLEIRGTSTGIQTTQRPLWQRLNDLDAGPVIADDPPVTIPLPCKPTFFDLAGTTLSDQVPYEALDVYLEEQEPQTKTSSSGGLFGWFSSS
jgi:hypothetical protein